MKKIIYERIIRSMEKKDLKIFHKSISMIPHIGKIVMII